MRYVSPIKVTPGLPNKSVLLYWADRQAPHLLLHLPQHSRIRVRDRCDTYPRKYCADTKPFVYSADDGPRVTFFWYFTNMQWSPTCCCTYGTISQEPSKNIEGNHCKRLSWFVKLDSFLSYKYQWSLGYCFNQLDHLLSPFLFKIQLLASQGSGSITKEYCAAFIYYVMAQGLTLKE
jgi:hypothetical protein